jgi:hypothetical protein
MTTLPTQSPRPRHTPQAPRDRRPSAEQVLREAAYVLQLTRRVRTAILDERSEPDTRPGADSRPARAACVPTA